MNSKGIMHRDIKPTNIMVTKDNQQVKIIDFGMGEFYNPNSAYNFDGTLHYMAPEIMMG
jgi:serine/threonine protein kinase